jgi:hypothetical protein
MARDISPEILSALKNTPVTSYLTVVTSFGTFSDRDRLLSIGNLETAIRVDGAGGSGTVSIELSDHDEYLFNTYNTKNLHSEHVGIYQNFENLTSFLIFEGFIESPIVWDEGKRILTFDVITKTYDQEVGFAPEDGQFTNLKETFIGKAWPLGFGTPQYIPCMRLQEAPTSILLTPFGIPDIGLLDQIERLKMQGGAVDWYILYDYIDSSVPLDEVNEILAQNAEEAAQRSIAYAEQVAQITSQIPPLQAEYDDQAKWLPGHAHTPKKLKVSMENFPEGKFLIKVADSMMKGEFKRDSPDSLTGTLEVKLLEPTTIDPISYQTGNTGTIGDMQGGAKKYGFRFFPVGSEITIISEFSIPYVANCIDSDVIDVYAYRNFGGTRKLSLVPKRFYTVSKGTPTYSPGYNTKTPFRPPLVQYGLSGGNFTGNSMAPRIINRDWFQPVFINLKRPLSLTSFFLNNIIATVEQVQEFYDFHQDYNNRPYDKTPLNIQEIASGKRNMGAILNMKSTSDNSYGEAHSSHLQATEEWEDDIYVLLRSTVGPNIIDIMIWIIENFTQIEIDWPSFNFVRGIVVGNPAHFALFDKRDAYTLLSDIAFQAQCAIYIKENKFYIKYLPLKEAPADIITEDDIVEQSLSLTTTTSEDVVTKYTALWRKNYLPSSEGSKIVVYTNVAKYGVRTDEHDFFLLNQHYSVKKAITFLLIRKANVWKKISFKCFVDKLNLEMFDTVTINFTKLKICNGPVNGIVESAVYDSDEGVIDMTVWLPILVGTMEEDPLTFPANATIVDVFPTAKQIESGGGTQNLVPFKAIPLQTYSAGGSGQVQGRHVEGEYHTSTGEGGIIDTIGRPDSWGAPYPGDTATTGDNNSPLTYEHTTSGLSSSYDLRDYQPLMQPSTNGKKKGGSSYPGQILGDGDDGYSVKVYMKGLNNQEEAKTKTVKQLQIDEDSKIPTGTWVIVHELDGFLFMQVPVWL